MSFILNSCNVSNSFKVAKKEFDNGSKYTGKMEDGKSDGEGVLVYKNGDKYEGYFINGKINQQWNILQE